MQVADLARAARRASRELSQLTTNTKNAALIAMADALEAAEPTILEANAVDVANARENGTPEAIIDRLALNPARVKGMADGLRDLAKLADPVGQVLRGWQLPNGVHVDQVRVPLGVIGIIYEARPNVTADAGGICLKSGNAALLRGSSSAVNSNRAIVTALREGLRSAGITEDAITLVEGGHETTQEMMEARGLIDILIPRGGAGLIEAVVRGSQVPVIETGTGNCHLFVDASADLDMAADIIMNAKTQRPSVCNALETLLVHADLADTFLPRITEQLEAAGVTLHDEPEAFDTEFLSLDLAVKVVADLDEAIEHIHAHTTGHSETIVTNDASAQRRFINEIDAAAVLVNASSRFVDGGEFGFGAEIGISTQKLHARGPMALAEMTSTKYVVTGQGQTRA